MADIDRTEMTAEEFLELPESNETVELIDGEMIMTPAPTDAHQSSVGSIYFYLRSSLSSGILRMAPLDVKLAEVHVVQPDVFWVSDENTRCHVVDGKYWVGAPDLVVEVLSASTSKRDYGVKFDLYEQHGVREYWLVDQQALFVQVFRLDAGKFVRQGVFGKGEAFVASVLGDLKIDVTKLLEQ